MLKGEVASLGVDSPNSGENGSPAAGSVLSGEGVEQDHIRRVRVILNAGVEYRSREAAGCSVANCIRSRTGDSSYAYWDC